MFKGSCGCVGALVDIQIAVQENMDPTPVTLDNRAQEGVSGSVECERAHMSVYGLFYVFRGLLRVKGLI